MASHEERIRAVHDSEVDLYNHIWAHPVSLLTQNWMKVPNSVTYPVYTFKVASNIHNVDALCQFLKRRAVIYSSDQSVVGSDRVTIIRDL